MLVVSSNNKPHPNTVLLGKDAKEGNATVQEKTETGITLWMFLANIYVIDTVNV